jgi:hypothetical protein
MVAGKILISALFQVNAAMLSVTVGMIEILIFAEMHVVKIRTKYER